MRIPDYFAGYVAFPVTNHLMNRRGILKTYRDLQHSETLPPEAHRERQLTCWRALLRYAIEYIPFYREKYAGLAPEDIKTLADVKNIPPLRRDEVIENHRTMVDQRLVASLAIAEQTQRGVGTPWFLGSVRRHRLIRNTSTGSSGTPTVFYEDGAVSAVSWAHELRLKGWFGLAPGTREARMARVSGGHNVNSVTNRMRKALWHQFVLPGINLNEHVYAMCADLLNKYRPRILFGITSALTGLAHHIEQHGKPIAFQPELIITWAAPLHDHDRLTLERIFRCPTTNIYGSREVGHVAMMCPAGSLHINQEHYYVESVSEPAGELLVTTLFKRPMPFIRYQIGDMGSVGHAGPCSCGRTLLVMDKLLGRSKEVVVSPSGRMLAPNFWCRAFMGPELSRTVRRFQIVYERDRRIRLRVEPHAAFPDAAEVELRQYVERNLGADYDIVVDLVPTIEPQASGKYQLVINEANGSGAL